MAITREDIFKAAEEIKASGETPTLAAIRKRVGGGSFTTISETVKEWRATVAPKAPIQTPAPDMIRGRLEELGSELWAAAIAMANDRLASERSALDATRADLEAARFEAAELADQLAADVDHQREQYDQCATDFTRFRLDTAASRKEAADAASITIADLQEKLDLSLTAERLAQSQVRELSAKIDEMSARVEDAKAVALRESRAHADELNRHEATRQKLSAIEATHATCKTELASANKHAAACVAELAAIRQRFSEVESQSAVASATNVHLKEQASERVVELGRLHKQIADLTEALKNATSSAPPRKDSGKPAKSA